MKKLIYVLALALISIVIIGSACSSSTIKPADIAALESDNRAQTAPLLAQHQGESSQMAGYWLLTVNAQKALFHFNEDGSFRFETLPDTAYAQYVLLGTYEQSENRLVLRPEHDGERTPCHAIFGEYAIELLGEEEVRLDVIGDRCPNEKGLPSAILAHSLVRAYP